MATQLPGRDSITSSAGSTAWGRTPPRWWRSESRDAYRRLLAQGWTDAIRQRYPAERVYTFWDYFRNAWGRNAGLRIDYLFLNSTAARRLVDAGVDRDVRGGRKQATMPRLDRTR